MLKTSIEDLMRMVNRNNQTLERDIQIVLTYFGLGNQVFPTYDSVAGEFCISTRERVRQIVTDKFVNRIDRTKFPIVQTICHVIEKEDIRFVDDFIQELKLEGLIEGKVHIRGLFQLLDRFIDLDFKVYNLDIEAASENDFLHKEKLLIIKNGKQEKLRTRMKELKTLPGIHGMVNFLDVISKNNWLYDDIPLYQSLIQHSETAKVFFETGNHNMWYMFENRDNIIINSLGKVVNVTNQVKVDILAETIHSDISKRSLQKNIPSVSIIKQYLLSSSKIELNGEYAIINVDKSNLTDIESDIYNYFITENKFTVTFSELNSYLENKGYSEPTRKQKLYHCPFLYVDKSYGVRNYQLKLISQFSPQNSFEEKLNNYEKYKNLLKRLHGKTDINRHVKQRTEQYLLKRWLFQNKETEECAICGRTFSIKSLVAAHKKKRANCTEDERTDPNIVMPVCLFGCDHLYEHEYIRIYSGQIHIQNTDALQDSEKEYLLALENRKVDHRFLEGSESYFTIIEGEGVLV